MNLALRSDALVVPDWPAPPGVRALVTTRRLPGNSRPPFDAFNLGVRSGEDEEIVQANRDLLVRALGLPAAPRWLRQVHGTGVALFGSAGAVADEEPAAGAGISSARGAVRDAVRATALEPVADAAVTRERGVVLGILTADCLPILLCGDDGREIAAIHAGWRGLAAGVIEACLARLQTPAPQLLAWLGPAIGAASYEVGDEVRAAFVERDAGAAAAFAPTIPGHWTCDLYTLAQRRLAAAGVTRVFGGGFDTRSDARFYSYRRDGARSGRFASLIQIT